ncbi:MAG: SIS domain-containing protein [Candidatus Kapabacteria bacterium]|nr:SIS domain-containing protein [Candidatus Kapabacteria bacterium]
MKTSPLLEDVAEAIRLQRRALDMLESQIDERFERAVDVLSNAPSIIASGVGKSGFVAQKFAASLMSLGFPARFMHSTDALHGDIGLVRPLSVLVLFSKSGQTTELLNLIEIVRREGVVIVSITSMQPSPISERADVALAAPIVREYDRANLLPTASTTSALVMADLLLMSLAHRMPDSVDVLTRTHPNGTIGSLLTRTVAQCMHSGSSVPVVSVDESIEGAIHALDSHALGIACVVDEGNILRGILTDGDVRRLVERGVDLASGPITSVMTTQPTVIAPSATLHEALLVMESGQRQIGVLPVVDGQTLVGVIRLHDVVRAQIAGTDVR